MTLNYYILIRFYIGIFFVAIDAILRKTADKYNIKFILSGMNFAKESLSVLTWVFGHSDWKYIRSTHSKFSRSKLFYENLTYTQTKKMGKK